MEENLGKTPKISVITLGCSKNTVDSEQLLGQLKVSRVDIVDNVEEAEIAVINTCGFIDAAKQESIDAIVEAVERINSDYERYCRAARALAQEFFSYDVVLPRLLASVGL